ncbi:type I-C CRISPR-associated protein Cas7/Csd2 [Heyndrickxia acidiproducens]|uniref:type I-C CRISPR-associated protein Cas7/Csd2 n=1 Tax=Heyndrickxia acidiproducens TaxID=1121084 RepID=UPI00037D80B5|nr:type I-C CRISPR-associated protein Cas7/Csd2 [Heyndrickxia acidiproducens]
MNINSIIDPNKRYDFILAFDVMDGNPNGDPDAGNLPRIDPETMQGIVTDVAIKRKIRDYIYLTRGHLEGFDIYVKHRGILTNEQKKAYEQLGKPENDTSPKTVKDARQWMCEHYFDTRMFGAVMSTKKFNAGQVRGAVQLTFARSVDPIFPAESSITRVALTNADDIKSGQVADEEARSGQMGRKAHVPYGLYIAYGFYTPSFAIQTGIGEEDLRGLWESLVNMWDLDHSASRGRMACRGLYVFSHESHLGNAPSNQLFEKIEIHRMDQNKVARSYKDYEAVFDEKMPEGVTLHKIVNSFENTKVTR